MIWIMISRYLPVMCQKTKNDEKKAGLLHPV